MAKNSKDIADYFTDGNKRNKNDCLNLIDFPFCENQVDETEQCDDIVSPKTQNKQVFKIFKN
jgi:hypothetical protein